MNAQHIKIEPVKLFNFDDRRYVRKNVVQEPFISVPYSKGYHIIKLKDVCYLNSDSNYTNIKLTDGREILSTKSLKYFEELLTENSFMRVHRSFIVCVDKIETILMNPFNVMFGIMTLMLMVLLQTKKSL